MPNFVVFRLRPDVPVLAENAILPAWDFVDYLSRHPTGSTTSNLSIEVFDLSTGAPIGTSAYSTAATARIKQHLSGSVKQSVATAVIELLGGTIDAGTIDLIVEVKKGSVLIMKFVAVNVQVNVAALPDSLAQYQGLTPGTYVTLPGQGVTFNPANKVELPDDSLPPNFTKLKNAVVAVAPGLSIALWNVSLPDCENMAAVITLPWQTNPMPAPSMASLEAMYTGTSFTAALITARNDYESQVNGLIATSNAQAQDRMTGYIFALCAARQCADFSAGALRAKLRFPTRPLASSNPATLTEMEVLLEKNGGGVLAPAIEVPAEYFYVHGADLPASTTPSQRYQQAQAENYASLVTKFDAAHTSGVIDTTAITDSNALPVNARQAARRLNALNTSGSGIALCALTAATPAYNLIVDWLAYPGYDIAAFWSGISTASQKEGHLNLVVCGLIFGYESSIDAGSLPPFGANDAEDLQHVDPTNILTESDWKGLFLGGTGETTKILFLLQVSKYFAMEPGSAAVPAVIDHEVPGFSASGNDPVQAFLACYKNASQGVAFQFGAPWVDAHFEAALDCVFGNDKCAREWLGNMIRTISELKTLASACQPEEMQFSIKEALFAAGFTSADSVLALTSAQFEEALVGTVAYNHAQNIYVEAGGTWATGLKECNAALLAPEEIATMLLKLGFSDAGSIAAMPSGDFEAQLAESPLACCAHSIHETATAEATAVLQTLTKDCDPDTDVSVLIQSGFPDPGSIAAVELSVFESQLPTSFDQECVASVHAAASASVASALHPLFTSALCPSDPAFLDQLIALMIAAGFTDTGSIAAVEEAAFVQGVNPQYEKCLIEVHENAVQSVFENLTQLAWACKDFHPVNDGSLVNCIPPKHLSPLSPCAYLHDLLELTPESSCSTPFPAKGKTMAAALEKRRGKIGEMLVTQANLCTPLPALDLAIESLEAMAASGNATGAIYNTSEFTVDGHYLLPNGAAEQPDDAHYFHDPVPFFEAVPEHSSPGTGQYTVSAYRNLKTDFSDPCCSPYNQPVDVSGAYLNRLGFSRFEVLRRFRKNISAFIFEPDPAKWPAGFQQEIWRCPVRKEIAVEYLCFTYDEYAAIFLNDFKTWSITATDLCGFLEQSCLTYCQFYELWQAGFVKFESDQQNKMFPACEPCCCGDYQIGLWQEPPNVFFTPLDADSLFQLTVFIRLWRKLQCLPGAAYSFAEWSDICGVLELLKLNGEINDGFLPQLAAFQMLRDEFGLQLTNGISGGGTGIDRTHILALWAGLPAGDPRLDWPSGHLLDRIQQHAQSRHSCGCRPPEFIKLLQKNLDPLSVLAGFNPDEPAFGWRAHPTHTLCFMELLSMLYASAFSIGEIFSLFTTGEQLAGDDPFPQQTNNESLELPFDLPDNEEAFSLWELRKKLLAVTVSDAEALAWTWDKTDAVLRQEFGYDPGAGTDHLLSLGMHYFPNTLETLGYSVGAQDRQYRAALAETSTAPLLWNGDSESPFRYDTGADQLWVQIPLSDESVIAKLGRVRQLKEAERKAVKEVYFLPRADLAHFGFLFSNFTEAQEMLIQEPEEAKRWSYFQKEFALAYKRCLVIAEHLTQHVVAATGQESKEGPALAWKLLRHLYADENKTASEWEATDDSGTVPPVNWTPQPNGGAFSALLGLAGTGLLGEFKLDDGTVVWREYRGGADAFGAEENGADLPIPTILSDLSLNASYPYATVRNGLALENPSAKLLGGAQGYTVCWNGVLLVEKNGAYTFRAGAPTPGTEAPDFTKAAHAKWSVTLKRTQKQWTLLSWQDEDKSAPADCSQPVQLKRGAYDISIQYTQPAPTFESREESCPQTTGFQVKYKGADTGEQLMTIPIERLYVKKKDAGLEAGIDFTGTDDAPASRAFLQTQYTPTIRDNRRTYRRAFNALLFIHRFGLSAAPVADDGQSEIDYFLSQPACFAGASYYFDDVSDTWKRHLAHFNFNFLPVSDNYCPPDPAQEQRAKPSSKRMQALFDWWRRIFEYARLRREANTDVWLMFHEAAELNPTDFADHHLLAHLGVDLSHGRIDSTTPGGLVTDFYPGYSVTNNDLKDERWAIRVWEAEKCIREMLCRFTPKDVRQARPDRWVADDLVAVINGESGNGNLMKFVRDGLIENGEPRRYRELKELNDGIRERSRAALIAYLTHKERIQLPDGSFATTPKHLSEVLLQDVEAGLCQKASRVEEAVSAVHQYVNRGRLGLEACRFTSDFRLVWEKRMETYHAWEQYKRREVYRENWIEYDLLEEARKSEAFLYLEDQLRRQTLASPVSGGMELLSSAPPPAHNSLTVLQKRTPALLESIAPAQEGFDLMGIPEAQSRPTWLASTPPGKVPFWLEAAARLGIPFVRVAAAGIPPADITYDCEHCGGCACRCGEHLPSVDEYFFSLIPSGFYEHITQDAGWEWDDAAELPELLHWNSSKMAYLAWVKVHRGEIGQARWSPEGVRVEGMASPDLVFLGRIADTLNFSVQAQSTTPDLTVPPTLGFRYDMAPDTAVVIPSVGQTMATSAGVGGLSDYPYFAYFAPGAPVAPTSNYGAALIVANNLATHCQYEAALKWYELAINPLVEDNRWAVCNGGLNDSTCCQGTSVEDNIADRRSLLLYYVETLLKWGKALMRQNMPERFQQARLIFDTAAKILGNCPETVYSAAQAVEMKVSDFTAVDAPLNPRLLCLYEQAADGLSMIHACMNSGRLKNGAPNRDMPYWGDSPYQNACCDDDGECCNDSWCLPASPYRFNYLLNKAIEQVGTVSSFGGAMLSAIEKREAETLAYIREGQGKTLMERNLEIKQNQWRAADWDLQGIQMARVIAETKLAFTDFLILQDLIFEEDQYEDDTQSSKDNLLYAKIAETVAQVAMWIPDPYTGQNNFLRMPAGSKVAEVSTAVARIFTYLSSIDGTNASLDLTRAGWFRRRQEWLHTRDLQTLELKQIDRQLLASERRRDIALRELNNHSLQMQHAAETYNYLRDKFTSPELYLWMQKELTALHYQAYECALQTARQAQAAYNRELGFSCDNFLGSLCWDNLHEGLLAGEKLSLALRRMEKAYMDNNARRYEITKQISLRQHFPEALLRLKTNGYCEIQIPEELFDLDYPGHYLRMMKSVSLDIPCVVGPYTSVNCQLKLESSKVRVHPRLQCSEPDSCASCNAVNSYKALPGDPRMAHEYVAAQSIATSSAQNDSGVFQLDFRDERILPFEFFGPVGNWRIDLPKENNYFDLHTVSDLILKIAYTAKEGGDMLRKAAGESAKRYLPGNARRLFDLRNDKPDAWFQFESSDPKLLPLSFGRNDFPYLPYPHELKITRTEIFIETKGCEPCDHLEVFYKETRDCKDCDDIPVNCVRQEGWGGMFHGMLEKTFGPLEAAQNFGSLVFPATASGIERVYLLCTYEVVRKGCATTATCSCCH